jgi:hypothetical protein
MKINFRKTLTFAIAFFAMMSFMVQPVQVGNSYDGDNSTYIEYTCKYGQCYATAKSTGQRCKHCVSNKGDKYCYQHKPKY